MEGRKCVKGGWAVDNLDITPGIDEDVLGLEVPVDDVERVEILEGEHDLSCVKPRLRLATRTFR